MEKKKLEPDVEARMIDHARRGRAAREAGDIEAAEAAYVKAWETLPEPRIEFDHSESIARAMVDFFRDTRQFAKAYEWVKTTYLAYGDPTDPSVMFLHGTVAFRAGDIEEAFRLFAALASEYWHRPFQGYDSAYLAFYKQEAKLRRRPH